jgi:hypothetical protein
MENPSWNSEGQLDFGRKMRKTRRVPDCCRIGAPGKYANSELRADFSDTFRPGDVTGKSLKEVRLWVL